MQTFVLSIGYTETKYIKLKTKFQIFDVDISTFLYTFERGGKEKRFSCPPFSKVYKKLSNFHLRQQKILVFSS